MNDRHGFALLFDPPEGTLRFIPPGCATMIVYSDDGTTFWEEPATQHAGHPSDLDSGAFLKASEMGKYKLDNAVRAAFPRYAKARPKQ